MSKHERGEAEAKNATGLSTPVILRETSEGLPVSDQRSPFTVTDKASAASGSKARYSHAHGVLVHDKVRFTAHPRAAYLYAWQGARCLPSAFIPSQVLLS